MPHIIAPSDRAAFWAVMQGGNTLAAGVNPPGGLTVTGSDKAITSDASEQAFLSSMVGKAGNFKPLPDSGRLEAGDIYGYNGGLVIVRQPHTRTIYAPEDTPNLFTVYREGGPDVLEWVAGERLELGARRTHASKTWEVYAPVGDNLYAPDLVPAIWREVVVTPPGPQPWVAPTGAHDAYKKGDRVTFGGFTWESTVDANVWAPNVYGWTKL